MAVTLDHLHQLAQAFDMTTEALLAERVEPREADLLRAVRSGDRPAAVAALARAMEIAVEDLALPDDVPPPSAAQFEALGRNAAQLARSAASIVATLKGMAPEALLADWNRRPD